MARPRPGPRPRRRWLWWLLLALVLLIAAAAALLWWLTAAVPDYWRVIDADEPAVRRGGTQFERRITSQLTRVRPVNRTWKLRVKQRRINQWLTARLPMWLENRGVSERTRRTLRHPMLAIREGYVELAMRVERPALSTILRLRYEPVDPAGDGPVRLSLRSVHAGRLPLPADYVLDRAVGRIGGDDRSQDVKEALRGLRSIELRGPLEDGRRVSVMDIHLSHGAATLTCRTERNAGR